MDNYEEIYYQGQQKEREFLELSEKFLSDSKLAKA